MLYTYQFTWGDRCPACQGIHLVEVVPDPVDAIPVYHGVCTVTGQTVSVVGNPMPASYLSRFPSQFMAVREGAILDILLGKR